MIIAFVPCRLQSSRLPNKAIKEIYGIPAIERCLINTLSINGIDKVVLATSINKSDDKLKKYNLNGSVEVVRGPEDDVLERFMPTINKLKPDHIIRVTGDCPLVSPELGQEMIDSHINNNLDVTYTVSNVALGIAIEVYKTSAIYKLKRLQKKTNHSEYLIYYFVNNPSYFSLNMFEAPKKYIKNFRLTLDELNDLELFNLIYETLNISNNAPVGFDQVLEFFDANPNAINININNKVKYKDDLKLVKHLKKVTTI